MPGIRRQIRSAHHRSTLSGRRYVTPYSGGGRPLALEATLEKWIPGQPLTRDRIMVWERREPILNLLVLFDTSLSMGGPERVPAAVAAAVLARETAQGKLALLAFHAEAESVIHFGERIKPLEAAYRVLKLPMGGVTDLNAALAGGLNVLAGRPDGKTETVLITDAERTAGPAPVPIATHYRGLNVILIGRRNLELAKNLTIAGKGRFRQVADLKSLPGALTGLLGSLAGKT